MLDFCTNSGQNIEIFTFHFLFPHGLCSLIHCQLQRNARMASSAVPAASASRRLSCATMRPTAMTAAMRPPAQPPPAAPSPYAAKTRHACPACGPATEMRTAPTAQTRLLRCVARSPSRHPPGPAPPRSSTAAAASASTRAGGAMAETTAWIAQTRATAVSDRSPLHI